MDETEDKPIQPPVPNQMPVQAPIVEKPVEKPDEIPSNILIDMLKKTVVEKTEHAKSLERQIETLSRTLVT